MDLFPSTIPSGCQQRFILEYFFASILKNSISAPFWVLFFFFYIISVNNV